MPAPDITPLPVAPQREDTPAVFVSKADAFVAALEDLPGEINAFGDYLNGLALSGVTGPITGTALTMTTARLLGRTTASSGAIEEISIGSGLSMTAGVLSASGSTYTDEQARDAIGAALVAGAHTGILVTVNDGGDSISLTKLESWPCNFTAAGDLYIFAEVAMTIDSAGAAIGTGTLAYAKSTTAAPSTFSSTTLPATLQAGAWLKVTASSVTGFVAKPLKQTA